MIDEAVICVKCGGMVPGSPISNQNSQPAEDSGLTIAVKVLMIIGTIFMSISTFGIGLLWCIPMLISYFNKIKNGKKISTGFKICSALFVSMLGGILMCTDKNH